MQHLFQGRGNPTERLKKAKHWFSLNPAWQIASGTTRSFSAEVESPSTRHFSMAGKWCVLSGRAVGTGLIEFVFTAARGRRVWGLKEACLLHLPQVGGPSAEDFTSANSQEVLIKTYFAQVITVWWWHKKWARGAVQETIIRCNIWLAAEIIVLFYWV